MASSSPLIDHSDERAARPPACMAAVPLPSVAHVPGVVEGDEAPVLDRIVQPDLHLALWRRALPPRLVGLAALDLRAVDDIGVAVPVMGLGDAVDGLLAGSGYPDGPLRLALGMDVAAMARLFANTFALTAVGIRLEVIETDACRKFHVDHVVARLLSTFVGQGTQWLPVGEAPDGTPRQMRTGDVGIFKGRLATEKPAVLHRSPPIAAAGETRLLLAIDPPAGVASC